MSLAENLKIGFIGAGKMATALAGGLSAEFTTPEKILAADPSAEALQAFSRATGCRIAEDNAEVARESDVIFLAVKPQYMSAVLAEIGPLLPNHPLVISIAAGVSLATLEQGLAGKARVVRVMPNTPCLIGAGASAFAPGTGVSTDDARLVGDLLATVGLAFQLPESMLDAVTGLSGSGPAYVYQIIEALSDGGVRMGLPRETATSLAAQTLLGAARMVLSSGEHPASLKDAVTSPGGTTIAGLHALERGGLRGILMDAVEAATIRSRELSKSS
jgi:pyrroline-5-carboxylate reductase